jgi:hypothetical protein
VRFDENTMCRLSGDHTGLSSFAVSNVKRVDVFRCLSMIQMSRAPNGPREAAILVPSGETAGVE